MAATQTPKRPASTTPKGGLEGIVAGRSALCDIDGRTGRLLYAGYDIVDLAKDSSFEETCWLLWHGELPSKEELQGLRAELGANLDPRASVWDIAADAPDSADRMDLLRTQVSLLGMSDPDVAENSDDANRAKATRLVAQTPALIATSERISAGFAPADVDPEQSIAWNFLHLLHGEAPEPADVRAFDVCLILHAEHGMNASTFAARVTAATLSDMHSAVVSAIGTLKGPLHGGANERVMELLRDLPDVAGTRQHVEAMLAAKQRIMGFGHRVYRTEDPRATILREYSRELGERHGEKKWYELTVAVEKAVHETKGLYPNVDLYSGSVYTSLGIPQRLFTPIFAMSRMAGWTANVMEQHRDNRLIRPDSEYVGPAPRDYVPTEAR
ncbi:MAG: citrate synthase [Candidatus Dormibacteraeota bacterium]|uniref:Citrate synthase n=1 Tax=Candidatus Aeolococcus gillhamiae TaxID=3127015 RepID=A0A934K300_9BACT|nr:citrate synthase [Candidatus Dormibacteraeota bacterium]